MASGVPSTRAWATADNQFDRIFSFGVALRRKAGPVKSAISMTCNRNLLKHEADFFFPGRASRH